MTKEERYETLCKQVESLIAGETNETGMLANTAAAMKEMFPQEYFWVGFYLVRELDGQGAKESGKQGSKESRKLALGPFQGSVACYSIPFGKGVCGTAWAERRTLVVPDVEAFPGHIACSSLSRSEIVVPVFGADGNVKAVIDIDSTEVGTFDDVDALYLEKIAKILAKELRY
ncbi:MAG: GAF domain-containing protein [Prevotella sp.]|nr:GAF domain-containing protein [Prevotella sp.]